MSGVTVPCQLRRDDIPAVILSLSRTVGTVKNAKNEAVNAIDVDHRPEQSGQQ